MLYQTQTFAPQGRAKGAFSLLELLAVMAIGAVLMGLAVAAFNSIGRAGDLTRTGHDIAGILESARTHAMAHNTYVWVGFSEEPNDRLSVATVASRTGGAPAPGEAVAESDWIALDRVREFSGVGIVALPENAPHRGEDDPPVMDFAEVEDGVVSFSTGGADPKTSKTFDRWVIQFNNRGEALTTAEGVRRVTEIGLQRLVDGVTRESDNYVAIRIGGLSGSVSILRP